MKIYLLLYHFTRRLQSSRYLCHSQLHLRSVLYRMLPKTNFSFILESPHKAFDLKQDSVSLFHLKHFLLHIGLKVKRSQTCRALLIISIGRQRLRTCNFEATFAYKMFCSSTRDFKMRPHLKQQMISNVILLYSQKDFLQQQVLADAESHSQDIMWRKNLNWKSLLGSSPWRPGTPQKI